jgi:hypothetical protein
MIRTSRMNFHILYYIIMMYSRHSRDNKKMRNCKRKEKNNKENYLRKSRDSKKLRIKFWPISEDKRRKKRQEREWSN